MISSPGSLQTRPAQRDGVCHQHGHGHGPHSAGHRGHVRCRVPRCNVHVADVYLKISSGPDCTRVHLLCGLQHSNASLTSFLHHRPVDAADAPVTYTRVHDEARHCLIVTPEFLGNALRQEGADGHVWLEPLCGADHVLPSLSNVHGNLATFNPSQMGVQVLGHAVVGIGDEKYVQVLVGTCECLPACA